MTCGPVFSEFTHAQTLGIVKLLTTFRGEYREFHMSLPLRVYRLHQISSTKKLAGLLPLSKATIYRWVKLGLFPKPFKIGLRASVWEASKIDEYIAAAASGKVVSYE